MRLKVSDVPEFKGAYQRINDYFSEIVTLLNPNLSEMSDSYLKFIEEVKAEIQKQRISVVLNANSSMICL